MATAKRKTASKLDVAPTNGTPANEESGPWAGALRFEVYEENSGRHRWRLTTSDGRGIATSTDSYATHDEARRAATENRD